MPSRPSVTLLQRLFLVGSGAEVSTPTFNPLIGSPATTLAYAAPTSEQRFCRPLFAALSPVEAEDLTAGSLVVWLPFACEGRGVSTAPDSDTASNA
jgi:hypothetical protein